MTAKKALTLNEIVSLVSEARSCNYQTAYSNVLDEMREYRRTFISNAAMCALSGSVAHIEDPEIAADAAVELASRVWTSLGKVEW